jgi:uncharacterized protein with von Willebrand factor type A (vWA) domain
MTSYRSPKRMLKRAARNGARQATGNPKMSWRAAKKWMKRYGMAAR